MATYIVATTVAAVCLLAYTMSGFPRDHWLDLAIFLVAATASERWAVASSAEGLMSLSLTVAFAAAILFGPAFAGLVAIGGIIVSDVFISPRHWTRVLFNCAQLCVAATLTGIVFQQLSTSASFSLSRDALAVCVSGAVFLLVNNTLVTGILTLSGRSFWHEWMASFRDMGILYVSMAPLGALLAFAYTDSRWNILYFPFLILVIYTGFRLFERLQHETDQALVLLADTVDKRDEYTYAHSLRVAEYAGQVAHRLALPRKEIDLVVSAARVHDLGKIGTDNRILYKQASLTEEEWRTIAAHPGNGSDIAAQFSMYHTGQQFIRHHHERWDGRGYPDGLAGTQIPIGARIIAVADAYDAMTSDRPYRAALTPEIALAELRRGAGRQFDPDVVEVFIAWYRGERDLPALSAVPDAETAESCSYS